MKKPAFTHGAIALLACFSLSIPLSAAGKQAQKRFGKGNPFQVEELPDGKLKAQLRTMDPKARNKAMAWLHRIQFEEFDASSHLRVDKDGGVFIVCPDQHGECDGHIHGPSVLESPNDPGLEKGATSSPAEAPSQAGSTPITQNAPVSVDSPPAYNSKPGATRHIYLDFNGALVSGKAWSKSDGTTTWTSWNCAAWGTDGDATTFSESEQDDMRRVWERIAEDYAPFDVNVTTDIRYDPVSYTGDKNKVGWLLFTAMTDKTGAHCPHFNTGGVAYLDVFGISNYFSAYQPAWVTPTSAAHMAEAGSHEMGHNMGLSHDTTTTAPTSYYGGHSATSSATSWGPIMGAGFNRNLSQWSKGEYFLASQTQDDLALISLKIPYRTDDHGDTFATATPLMGSSGIRQSGIAERTGNADYFAFSTGSGNISFTAASYRSDTSTWGGNLDIQLDLYNGAQTLIASSNPAADTNASISQSVPAGNYYLVLRPSAAGSPGASMPSGYTAYGSLGKYTITGGAEPVHHFAISPIVAAQTVGTPITGFTVTAQNSSNATATSFTGTVTFGGTGGFSGTSASFTAGILNSGSVTPTAAGSNLTLTVNDGAGHTGTATIPSIRTRYAAWAGTSAFDGDSNGDGIRNGLAWVLGAASANVDASALLPTISTGVGKMTFTFRRSQASIAPDIAVAIQVGDALSSWPDSYAVGASTATSGGGITVSKDTPAIGTDTVTLTIPLLPDGRRFARLKVIQNP